MERAEKAVREKSQEEKEQILQNFEEFKNYLGDKVEKGQKLGLSEEAIAKSAKKVADYLAKNEEPKNREEYLLQQLWKVGEEEDSQHLARMLVRLTNETS
jgi:DNA-binding response OmpR family regulator